MKLKCCICGKESESWGNNPAGAIGEDGQEIIWKDDDRCCDECNRIYVVPGRIALLLKNSEVTERVPKVPNENK